MKNYILGVLGVVVLISAFIGFKFFSEENQNKAKRYFGNQMGYKHGRVDTANPKMIFLQVEKLTSASATHGEGDRNYRYGYGYFDVNLNGIVDKIEQNRGKQYFDVNDFTAAVFRDMGYTDFEKVQNKVKN